ncbi:MAG: DUF4870 domain-containing protein [Pseudomonadota bacterium]
MSETGIGSLYGSTEERGSPGTANLVYILNIVGIVLWPMYAVAVIIAYLQRDEAAPWLRSHYLNQIGLFWKGLAYSIIAIILTPVLIGFVVWLVVFIWWIVRNVRGMQALARGEAYPTPGSWAFA